MLRPYSPIAKTGCSRIPFGSAPVFDEDLLAIAIEDACKDRSFYRMGMLPESVQPLR